ncbi:MAG: hypothetical protein AAGC92_14995 [Pseudomonadota bacterium]
MNNLDRAKDRSADRRDSKKKIAQQAARDQQRSSGQPAWKRLKAEYEALLRDYKIIKRIMDEADEERKRSEAVAKALAKVIKAAGELVKKAQGEVKSGTLQTTEKLDSKLQGMKTQIDGFNGLLIVMAFLATYFAQKVKK